MCLSLPLHFFFFFAITLSMCCDSEQLRGVSQARLCFHYGPGVTRENNPSLWSSSGEFDFLTPEFSRNMYTKDNDGVEWSQIRITGLESN